MPPGAANWCLPCHALPSRRGEKDWYSQDIPIPVARAAMAVNRSQGKNCEALCARRDYWSSYLVGRGVSHTWREIGNQISTHGMLYVILFVSKYPGVKRWLRCRTA